jgi:L-fucose dehydrogenase
MDLQLTGKVILITGGAKGIGAAITRAVVREGAVPVIVDRDAPACDRIISELKLDRAHDHHVILDLQSPQHCAEAVAHAAAAFGRIDALINNAGVNDCIGLERGSPEKFLASLHLNLLHYYNMAHYVFPHLKAACGSIVNISSKTAVTGQGNTSGYVAAKGAILALTREWAAELLPCGIRVNAVVPSEVMTPLYEQWLGRFPDPQAKLKTIEAKIPLGNRMTTSDEIAGMVVFLISAQASHITGQHIYVDGGYVHLDRALT